MASRRLLVRLNLISRCLDERPSFAPSFFSKSMARKILETEYRFRCKSHCIHIYKNYYLVKKLLSFYHICSQPVASRRLLVRLNLISRCLDERPSFAPSFFSKSMARKILETEYRFRCKSHSIHIYKNYYLVKKLLSFYHICSQPVAIRRLLVRLNLTSRGLDERDLPSRHLSFQKAWLETF